MSLYPLRLLQREKLSTKGASDGDFLSYSAADREWVLTPAVVGQSLAVGQKLYAEAVIEGVTFTGAPLSLAPACVTSVVGPTYVSGGETHAFDGVNPASHTITTSGFQVSIRGRKSRIADESNIVLPVDAQQVESEGIKFVFYSSDGELVMRESTDNLPLQWGSAVFTSGDLTAANAFAACIIAGRPAVVWVDLDGNVRYARATTATSVTAFSASVVVTNEALAAGNFPKLQDFAGVPIVHFINGSSLLKVRYQSAAADADGGGTWADGAATLNVGTRTLLTNPLRSTNFYSIGVYGGANTGLLVQDADPTATRTGGADLFTQPTSLQIALRDDDGLVFLAKENANTDLSYGVTSIENPITVEISFGVTTGGLLSDNSRVVGIVLFPTKAVFLFQTSTFSLVAVTTTSLSSMVPVGNRIISLAAENGMTTLAAVKCVDVNNRGLSWNYLANGTLYNEVLTGTLGYTGC